MAIFKTGDLHPIESVYDSEGETQKCAKCGSKLVVIAIEGNDNKLVCECCENENKGTTEQS